MKRYLIQLAYKGTNFNGWQRQKSDKVITVQGSLEHSLSLILREKIAITGAGRTDTGVHASFFVAHFDTNKSIKTAELTRKINAVVNKDIVVHQIIPAPADFHARFSALSRTYTYHIHLKPNPFIKEFSHYIYWQPDIKLMQKATDQLFEYEDFKAFSKAHSGTNHYLVKLYSAAWKQEDDKLIFTIKANRFLRNMVRAIVGTMLEISRGKLTIEDMNRLIRARNRRLSSFTAPACGLFLSDIEYPEEINQLLDRKIKYFWDEHL